MTSIKDGRYKPSTLEYAFLNTYLARLERCDATWLPVPEYRPWSDTAHRLDFAFPFRKAAVELQGAIRISGKYNRAEGILSAAQKYNRLQDDGWHLYILHNETVAMHASRMRDRLDKLAVTMRITPHKIGPSLPLLYWLYQEQIVFPWRLSVVADGCGKLLVLRTSWHLTVESGRAPELVSLAGEEFVYEYSSQSARAKACAQAKEMIANANYLSGRQ